MYTLSVSYNNLIEISKQSSISIDEVFSQIKLYGISSIDIDYDLICNDFNTLSKIKRNNIKIASIISCDNISITENVSKQLEIVDFLVKLDNKSLIFNLNSVENVKTLTKNLRRITNYAKTYDIQVSILNTNLSYQDILYILKNVKGLLLTYDISNSVLNDYNHLEIAKWINKIYLYDVQKNEQTVNKVKLFSGNIEMLNTLKEILNERKVSKFTLNYENVENLFNIIEESAIEFKMEF